MPMTAVHPFILKPFDNAHEKWLSNPGDSRWIPQARTKFQEAVNFVQPSKFGLLVRSENTKHIQKILRTPRNLSGRNVAPSVSLDNEATQANIKKLREQGGQS